MDRLVNTLLTVVVCLRWSPIMSRERMFHCREQFEVWKAVARELNKIKLKEHPQKFKEMETFIHMPKPF